MIPLLTGKNPIYFGVITIIPFDNLYRRAYFVMHTFLVHTKIMIFILRCSFSYSYIPKGSKMVIIFHSSVVDHGSVHCRIDQ